jgi:prepilin-type N-terminal cleavage/methylation domain-containing protein
MSVRGFVMAEVLVALVVLSVAVTACLALALESLAATAEARRAEIAAGFAADLAGRTRAMPGVDWTALPEPAPCGAACTPEGLAALEFAAWRAALRTALPAGAALLAAEPDGGLLLTLAWNDTGGLPRELELGIAR